MQPQLTFLIPTRNRPTSLRSMLGYYERFVPDARVIVADGSRSDLQQVNANSIKGAAVDVEHQTFDPNVGLFERLLTVLSGCDSELIVMAADDDYPVVEHLADGYRFLIENPDYVSAHGSTVFLSLLDDGAMTAMLRVARRVDAADAHDRVDSYLSWPVPTTYAVTRRSVLLDRYERARACFLPGWFDIVVGTFDCLAGKVHALDGPTFIGTRNPAHSYLRPDDSLFSLRRAPDVLRLLDRVGSDLQHGGLNAEQASAAVLQLTRSRLAHHGGMPDEKRTTFESSGPFRDPLVQSQLTGFADLFTAGTAMRRDMEERMVMVRDLLRTVAQSNDNPGEPAVRTTMVAGGET